MDRHGKGIGEFQPDEMTYKGSSQLLTFEPTDKGTRLSPDEIDDLEREQAARAALEDKDDKNEVT